MKTLQKTSWVAAFVFGTAVLLGQAGAVPADAALPSGESILDHFVEVTGGKAAYAKHTTELMSGLVAFPAQGLTGKLLRYAAAPNTEYSITDIGQAGKFEFGVTDGITWDKNSVIGARIKTGEEKTQALREAVFNGTVDWRAIYAKAETTGTETVQVEGGMPELCYKVVLTPKTGRPETRFYSKTSGFLLKTTTNVASPMGDLNVEVSTSNYRDFDGVKYPVRSKQAAGGQQVEITITNIVFNDPIPAEYLTLPAEIRALMPKTPPAKSGK